MPVTTLIDLSTITLGCLIFLILFLKKIRNSKTWDATVIPLASITDSGFLIIAPILWMLAGTKANGILLIFIIVAYGTGTIIRYNIEHAEPLLTQSEKDRNFTILNDLSYITLGISYFISVTFYIRILSAFTLKIVHVEDPFIANALTSLILLFIGITGYFRGFDRLEFMEVISVNIKISLISMLILGLFLHDWLKIDFEFLSTPIEPHFNEITIRKIFGIFLIVQGFETSRYMGDEFPAQLRIKTMKIAQIISGFIYLIFTFLILYLMEPDQKITETAIVDLTRQVSPLLPYAVMLGAILSQFSAAIADMVGCSGIISEYSKQKISQKVAYFFISLICIGIVWSADVFEIIALASRLFAAYYFTQCVQALYINHHYQYKNVLWTCYFFVIGLLMLLVAIFGIS